MDHQHGTPPPPPRRSSQSTTTTGDHENARGGWGTPRRVTAASSSSFSSAPPTSTTAVIVGPANNRQEVLVEVYEHERWSRKANGWLSSEAPRRAHWCTVQGMPSSAPEEMDPPSNFGWVSNWRVDTSAAPPPSSSSSSIPPSTAHTPQPSVPSPPPPPPPPPASHPHDRQGWEYATAPDKFLLPDRTPRGEERWSDRARRRRWIRLARYKTLLPAVTAPHELGKQAQEGLKGLVRGRRTLQELCGLLGTRRDSADLRTKMFNLVEIVRQHGREIEQVLKSLRERERKEGGWEGGSGSGGVGVGVGGVKKWTNDLSKEQRVFEEVAREVERKCRSLPLAALPGARGGTTAAAAAATAGAGAAAESHPRSSSSNTSDTEGGGRGGGGGGGGGAVAASPSSQRMTVSAGRDSFRPFVNMDFKVQDRAHHHTEEEEAILKQLKFQDEEEVMLALTLERELAIKEVTMHLSELKDVFSDFAQLVSEQQEGIDAVCRNVEDAHARTEEGYQAILKAKEGQKKETQGCVLS